MKKFIACLVVLFFITQSYAQKLTRPKLVVGIVVDQMRWDYLYRYYDRYDAKGGFNRMLNQGFSCDNTLIPYTPTITACGHSSIFTGSVPAIHGIAGNAWWDRDAERTVYCTEDKAVNTVGSNTDLGKMSPKNLLVTSVCDELRLATNFKSKVIGIALKDRGGILPAGHSANAAYWYDNKEGKWITSTYYMKELPNWVSGFNKQNQVDKFYTEGWSLLYPASTYTQSTADEKSYEGKPFGDRFPYDLRQYIGKDYGKISTTPMGNTLTANFAKAAIVDENLGKGAATDFITISFSSTDYIGHTFGPNSVEAEDCFLRLDKDLGSIFDLLDARLGRGQYTVFLSADHGAAHVPELMQENKLPGERVFLSTITKNLNKELKEKYQVENLIASDDNYQFTFNPHKLDSAHLSKAELKTWLMEKLNVNTGISRVIDLEQLNVTPMPSFVREMLNEGYYPRRGGDVQIILKPGFIEGYSKTGTTHGLWNPYDAHIPLLWYGWGIRPGKSNKPVKMTDIAPTVAALLHIQAPSGCIGKPIEDIVK